MNYDLVISSSSSEAVIALLKDKQLVELHKQRSSNNFSVGDIYLGKVKKIMPGLNAAFVNIGYEKDAFLHYLDLGPQINSFIKFTQQVQSGKQNASRLDYVRPEKDINKGGKIDEVVKSGQQILVQVAKEPISTKGPRITSEISIAGRYIVLLPFNDKISVSQKIKSSEERDRLKKIIKDICPKNFGVIIRTVAENKKVEELDADMKDLMKKWHTCFEQLKKANAPQRVLGELDRTSALLRDILNPDFNNIYTDDPKVLEEVKAYLHSKAPEKEHIAKLYSGKVSIFEHFGIEKQIKASFGKTVTFKSGAYLVIEHTEALHVIDVNSGHRAKSDSDQETNALDCNLEAAKEIARQLRLRDMGGIIVVDFIDLHKADNRKILFEKMRDEMKDDKAKHNILPPTKFGLVQITRQRVRPEMNIETLEKCPACDGTGEVGATVLFIDEIENNLRFIMQEQNEKKVTISVHPFIEAFLTKGIFSLRWKWQRKYKGKIKVESSNAYHFLEYHFLNAAGEEIKL
ncbi:MAG: Ribonuclease G [Bacteroidia bacterium]|nr:Ribonuclease G [Bacteroidia bacterium]